MNTYFDPFTSYFFKGVELCCGCRRGEFPRLQQFCINECSKLTGKLPKQLRSLKKLEISSSELVGGIQLTT